MTCSSKMVETLRHSLHVDAVLDFFILKLFSNISNIFLITVNEWQIFQSWSVPMRPDLTAWLVYGCNKAPQWLSSSQSLIKWLSSLKIQHRFALHLSYTITCNRPPVCFECVLWGCMFAAYFPLLSYLCSFVKPIDRHSKCTICEGF